MQLRSTVRAYYRNTLLARTIWLPLSLPSPVVLSSKLISKLGYCHYTVSPTWSTLEPNLSKFPSKSKQDSCSNFFSETFSYYVRYSSGRGEILISPDAHQLLSSSTAKHKVTSSTLLRLPVSGHLEVLYLNLAEYFTMHFPNNICLHPQMQMNLSPWHVGSIHWSKCRYLLSWCPHLS